MERAELLCRYLNGSAGYFSGGASLHALRSPGFSATGRSAILADSFASRSTAFRGTVHVTTCSVLRLIRKLAMRLAKPLYPTTSHDDPHVDTAFPNAPGPVQRSVFAVVH
jgi:hypothetical protein